MGTDQHSSLPYFCTEQPINNSCTYFTQRKIKNRDGVNNENITPLTKLSRTASIRAASTDFNDNCSHAESEEKGVWQMQK